MVARSGGSVPTDPENVGEFKIKKSESSPEDPGHVSRSAKAGVDYVVLMDDHVVAFGET